MSQEGDDDLHNHNGCAVDAADRGSTLMDPAFFWLVPWPRNWLAVF
jgi:hypothetical protein